MLPNPVCMSVRVRSKCPVLHIQLASFQYSYDNRCISGLLHVVHGLPIQADTHSISRISRCPWACLRRCKVGTQDKLQTSSLPDMYNTDRILNPSRPILPALSCPVTSPNFEPQEACTSALSLALFVYMPNPAFRVSLLFS